MVKKLFATAALLFLCAGLVANAHAADPKNAYHLNGTVTKMAGDTVTVTVGENSADALLLPTTTYKVGAKPASRSDLAVGDTVDLLVVRHNPNWETLAVKITHPKAAKK